jgi:lipopolysaccharide export system protein LptC
MPLLPLLRNAFDRLALYLPALVMGVFALSSWWLVRSVPDLHSPTSAKAVRKEPDYFLHGFSVKSFDANGRLVRELHGQHARRFPEFDVLDMDTVEIQSINGEGQHVVARADHVQSRAQSPQQEAQTILTGNANVVRINLKDGVRTELRSDRFTAFEKGDRVISDTPVEIRRGPDRFSADRMVLNGESGEYHLDGRVRGMIMPTHK